MAGVRPTESGLVRVRKEWARTLCAGGAGARLVLKNSNRPNALQMFALVAPSEGHTRTTRGV